MSTAATVMDKPAPDSFIPLEEEIIARASAGTRSLPMLDVIFSRLTTDLISAFKVKTGLLAEITLAGISYTSWANAMARLDEFGPCAIAEAQPWGGNLVVAMDRDFFFASLETQMSGTPKPGTAPRRTPSTIERRIAARQARVLLDEMARNFARLTEVTFTLDVIETAQQAASLQGAGSACVSAKYNVVVSDCPGTITVVIPLSTLEGVQDTLSKMFLGEKLGGDTTWREHIKSRISGSTVELKAVLHETQLPMADVLQWKPGMTIDLGIPFDPEAKVVCSGMAILFCKAGQRSHGRFALRVTREHGDPGPEDRQIEKADLAAGAEE